MKIVNKFQQGGAMAQPAPETATAQQDPVAQIVDMFMIGLQNQDCEALAAGAEMFLGLVQQASAQSPMGEAPGEQPVFRRGGVISRKR